MIALLALAGVILAGAAFAAVAWWLERGTRRPGLGYVIVALSGFAASAFGLTEGQRLLPLLLTVEGVVFLYLAFLSRSAARAT